MTEFSDNTGDESLLKTVMGYATPENIGKLSGVLGESPQTAKTALTAAVPALIGAIARTGSSGSGARTIMDLIQRFGLGQGDPASSMTRALEGSNRGESDIMGSASQSILNAVMGDRTEGITQAIARFSGAKSGSISKMFSMLAPFVLGLIGRKAQGHDANWLSSYLSKQEASVRAAMPAGLRSFLSPAASVPTHGRRGEPEKTASWWLPLAAIAALILGGIWLFNKRKTPETPQIDTTTIVAPTASLSAGNQQLRDFLANVNPDELPKVITFRELNFDTGTATLDQASIKVVDDLAASLEKHPDVRIRLEGHTDGVGSPTANKELSLARASAVRDRLASRGIDVTVVEVAGEGDEKPVAPNDTDQGRALNRRVEVVVIGMKGAEGTAH